MEKKKKKSMREFINPDPATESNSEIQTSSKTIPKDESISQIDLRVDSSSSSSLIESSKESDLRSPTRKQEQICDELKNDDVASILFKPVSECSTVGFHDQLFPIQPTEKSGDSLEPVAGFREDDKSASSVDSTLEPVDESTILISKTHLQEEVRHAENSMIASAPDTCEVFAGSTSTKDTIFDHEIVMQKNDKQDVPVCYVNKSVNDKILNPEETQMQSQVETTLIGSKSTTSNDQHLNENKFASVSYSELRKDVSDCIEELLKTTGNNLEKDNKEQDENLVPSKPSSSLPKQSVRIDSSRLLQTEKIPEEYENKIQAEATQEANLISFDESSFTATSDIKDISIDETLAGHASDITKNINEKTRILSELMNEPSIGFLVNEEIPPSAPLYQTDVPACSKDKDSQACSNKMKETPKDKLLITHSHRTSKASTEFPTAPHLALKDESELLETPSTSKSPSCGMSNRMRAEHSAFLSSMLKDTASDFAQKNIIHKKIASACIAPVDGSLKPFTESQLKSLYYNPELEANREFIDNFIEDHRAPKNHEFQEILLGYLRARNNLQMSTKEIQSFQTEFNQLKENLWVMTEHVISSKGHCEDGKLVSGSHTYNKSVFNESAAVKVDRLLKQIREQIHDHFALYAYSSQMGRLQVEAYLFNLLLSSPDIRNIPHNTPIQGCQTHQLPIHISAQIENLKQCISILFAFQRKPIKDKQFVSDTRAWLSQLVAVLLRVATYEDHLFLLNHVLRCPAGVGDWAAAYIQLPLLPSSCEQSSFGDQSLDHAITVLATLLLPVKGREEFLQHVKSSVVTSLSMTSPKHEDDIWVLIDSEGEEDDDPSSCWMYWRENDLVTLLNQIPLESIFRHVLRIDQRDG